MLILAIDTTTRGGSVALADDEAVRALVPGDPSRTHGERLPGEIARVLADAGVGRRAIDLVAVASGPGAFTGLRIGLATAQGLAMALDRPVVGVPSLDALAWGALSRAPGAPGERILVPWMDAQRGEVFAAVYKTGQGATGVVPWTVVEPALTAPPAVLLGRWLARLAGHPALFVGDAVSRDAGDIARAGAGAWQVAAPEALAPAIAQLGRRMAAAGQAGPPHALAPIYVRRPDAEIERERRGAR